MNKNFTVFSLILLASFSVIFFSCKSKNSSSQSANVSLTKDLLPLFQRSCGICHNPDGGESAIKNGVFYANKEDILGKVNLHIIPGKPEESGLLKVLAQKYKVGESKIVMPPPGTEIAAWSKDELALFSGWIKSGARDN